MAIKIGHASIDENGRANGGTAGDQTGRELCTRTWYSSPWDTVLRCKDSKKAELMAKACEAACANTKIGYDQYQRNTLNDAAKAVGYDLSKITKACECDCSSLMTVCAQAAGIDVPYVYGNAPYTGNMKAQFTSTGLFEVLTASKYLTSDKYLKRGDILLRTSGHTAMALENGSSSSTKDTSTNAVISTTTKSTGGSCTMTLTTLSKGNTGAQVKALQILLIGYGYSCGKHGADGDFGDDTDNALRKFQKAKGLIVDGKCGSNTWNKLLKG